MLKCKDIGYLSSDYIDGNMTKSQRMSFRLHLTICGHCRRFMRQMNLIHQTLPKYRFVEPDDQQIDAWVNGLSK